MDLRWKIYVKNEHLEFCTLAINFPVENEIKSTEMCFVKNNISSYFILKMMTRCEL